jgi:uncharacterized damage-inducible protein DinB
MIKEFFQDKFDYDLQANLNWILTLEQHESSLDEFLLRSFSHLLNVHHIWNNRLMQSTPESNTWDLLPIEYFTRIAKLNHNETIDYLEKIELGEKIHYHSSEGIKIEKDDIDILYHILNHSNYHRAQIALQLRELNIIPPSLNFIVYR